MPCNPEKLAKLDSMLDELFAPKADASVEVRSKEKDCDDSKKDGEREELRTGALSKRE
jgi:hypothetical protein